MFKTSEPVCGQEMIDAALDELWRDELEVMFDEREVDEDLLTDDEKRALAVWWFEHGLKVGSRTADDEQWSRVFGPELDRKAKEVLRYLDTPPADRGAFPS
jgi:hypothetical protein